MKDFDVNYINLNNAVFDASVLSNMFENIADSLTLAQRMISSGNMEGPIAQDITENFQNFQKNFENFGIRSENLKATLSNIANIYKNGDAKALNALASVTPKSK